MTIQYFDSLPSTNRYLESLPPTLLAEGMVVVARKQTAGIGQQGNRWESEAEKNLTFSLVLQPTFLPMARQYALTKAVALGVADWLEAMPDLQKRVCIKWPNDIYVDTNKIGGILISNRIAAGHMQSSIVGIGLNVNQTTFPPSLPNPTSLALITGRQHSSEDCLHQLLQALDHRYRQLSEGHYAQQDEDYRNRLLQRGETKHYIYNSKEIVATLHDVNTYGHLLLTTDDGELLSCQIKEVKFLL